MGDGRIWRLFLVGALLVAGRAGVAGPEPTPSPAVSAMPSPVLPPSPSATPVPQASTDVPVPIYPLPGRLDETLTFNSNSPEVVEQEGILLSTLPAGMPGGSPAFLDQPFQGSFTVFSHHIAKDATPGARLLYLGLVASNRSGAQVQLEMTGGATYLSQPEALFLPLAPLVIDQEARVYAGPGDRVATELIHGRAPLAPQTFTLDQGNQLLYSWPVPTDVAIPPPVNGRSTLLRMTSNGPVYLTEVAFFARKGADGQFVAPQLADYEQVMRLGTLSGPHEAASQRPVAGAAPGGKFTYGRVAGVSIGDRWTGTLFDGPGAAPLPGPGQRVGFPISAVYLNRMGTDQDHSAQLARRYPDTAFEAHANYGVTYALQVMLRNPGTTRRFFSFALSHPNRAAGKSPATTVRYLDPPNRPVMFRGTVKLAWHDETGTPQTRFAHLVLRHSQDVPPFTVVEVPPGASYDVSLAFIYPADATPPQLLTISG